MEETLLNSHHISRFHPAHVGRPRFKEVCGRVNVVQIVKKKLNIYQLLNVLFLYLFYFRTYEAKSNFRVERKARD